MRRVLIVIAVVLAIAARAQDAFAQCSIDALDVNGTLMLCAVDGSQYQWTGPNGFTSIDACVTATVAGTYTLRTLDPLTGMWSAPCSYLVGPVATAPQCGIVGADTVCAGSLAAWCAPSGSLLYSWSGPGGFLSTSACVNVSTAGSYTLQVTDPATGMVSDPCTKTLTTIACQLPGRITMCPMPTRWWSLGCGTEALGLDASLFAQVAARVDANSALWSFNGTTDGLCSVLRPRRDSGAMASAKRHYAAVLANLAAADFEVTARDGRRVGLDANAALDGVPGVAAGTTVSAWISATEASLLSMVGASTRDRHTRDECRRIQRQARAINRGVWTGGCNSSLAGTLDAEDSDDDGDLSEMVSTGTPAAMGGGATMDPLADRGHTRWTLTRPEQVELMVVDVTGRSIRHLASGVYSVGTHDWTWDGRDDEGRTAHSGVYFVAGRVGDQRLSQRLFVLR